MSRVTKDQFTTLDKEYTSSRYDDFIFLTIPMFYKQKRKKCPCVDKVHIYS